MTSIVLDAGALVAIDRGDRKVGAMLRIACEAKVPVRTSAAIVGQVWRDGAKQARLARVLSGIAVRPVDLDGGKQAGILLGKARTSDVVDAHVASMVAPGDRILTSDPDDIRRLLDARDIDAAIVRV
jgi:hypothetical protein